MSREAGDSFRLAVRFLWNPSASEARTLRAAICAMHGLPLGDEPPEGHVTPALADALKTAHWGHETQVINAEIVVSVGGVVDVIINGRGGGLGGR